MTTQASEGNNAHGDKCLYISSQVELEEFWVQILPAFVEMVDPDSGILIDLYSGGELLTDTDYESLVTGKDHVPRKHRARRLWCILSTYPLGVFKSKLAPKLCAWYGPIIPERFLTTPAEGSATGQMKPEEECFRHDVQTRVRLESLADLLCHHGCLPQDVYRKLLTKISRNVGEKWCVLFDALAQCPGELLTNAESPLHTLLNRYHVTCPDNIVDIQSRGFPCECKHPQASPPAIEICTKLKVLSWRERALYAVRPSVNPTSSDSSVTNVDVSSSSLSSSLRPVNASSGRSDMMATKTQSESDSHFDGIFCNGVGFPPFKKLTKKSVSEVNISANGGLQYMPLARARTDDSLDRSSSNEGDCIQFYKSASKGDKKYVTVEDNVSQIPECTVQGQASVTSQCQMEGKEGDVDCIESLEPGKSSGGNCTSTENCYIDIPDGVVLIPKQPMTINYTDTEIPMDETQVRLEHVTRSDNVENVEIDSTPENCLDRLLVYYEDHSFFTVFLNELHWTKNKIKDILQNLRFCIEKLTCRIHKIPPFPKQLFRVFWRTALLGICFSWILLVFTMGNPLEVKLGLHFLTAMWAAIFTGLGLILAVAMTMNLALCLPMLCCKVLSARVLTSVWVLWILFKTEPVVEEVSSMQEDEAYQTTSV